jgi:hypothetical protein
MVTLSAALSLISNTMSDMEFINSGHARPLKIAFTVNPHASNSHSGT